MLTDEQAAAETKYQLARGVFLRLHNDGIINDMELKELLTAVAAKNTIP